MRSTQSSIPRVKDRFEYEQNGERKLMILCIVFIFNLQTLLVSFIKFSTHTYLYSEKRKLCLLYSSKGFKKTSFFN